VAGVCCLSIIITLLPEGWRFGIGYGMLGGLCLAHHVLQTYGFFEAPIIVADEVHMATTVPKDKLKSAKLAKNKERPAF
jgi:hypothetical protein